MAGVAYPDMSPQHQFQPGLKHRAQGNLTRSDPKLAMSKLKVRAVFLMVLLGLVAAASGVGSTAWGSSYVSGNAANLSGTLNGSGSTFQLPFQQTAIEEFKSVQPNMTVNYAGGGSGKGRTDLASGVTNFGGSDATIPESEAASFHGTVLYFPVVIGPIALAYNLSGLKKKLRLSPDVVAKIFEGKITTWNDAAIKADNPGVKLPSTAITLAVRSDSSGTTQNFSDFLVKAAPSVWTLGTASTISWPASARAGSGNGGVGQIIKSTPGAIGYVDYPDAKAAGLTFAAVKNKDGKYIVPSPKTATEAAKGTTIGGDLTFSAVWAPGANAYPITYQSWVLVFQQQSNQKTASMLKAYIGYLLGDGQNLLPTLNYAKLPAKLDQKAKAQLKKIGS